MVKKPAKTAKKTKAPAKKTAVKKTAKKKGAAPKKEVKNITQKPKVSAKKPKVVQKPKAAKTKKTLAKETPRSKSAMTPREKKIQNIKKKLLDQRSALLDEAMAALNELPEQTVFPDLGDQASAEIDRNFMLRLRGRERKLLKKIETAIERIDSTTFGVCDKCGEPIDIRRLEARPVTTMCIECKTLQEEEEKLREK